MIQHIQSCEAVNKMIFFICLMMPILMYIQKAPMVSYSHILMQQELITALPNNAEVKETEVNFVYQES